MAKTWATKLYNSAAWHSLRAGLITKANYKCTSCGKSFLHDPSALIGHHITKLTPANINDPNITLNPANIKIVCKDCHDREHERFAYSKTRQVFIVYGSPCSGKSTYINQISQCGDIILDLDRVFCAISLCQMYDHPKQLNAAAFAVRDTILDQIKTRAGHWSDAYIVGGYPRKRQRETLANSLGAELVYIDATREECEARALHRGALADEWRGYIAKWWREYEP